MTTTVKTQEMKVKSGTTDIGISEQNRRGVADILNRTLSDEFVLYTKLRNYHWNVVGPMFQPLHEIFENQYDEVEEIIDNTAERTRNMGLKSIGTMNEFLQHTTLQEQPNEYPNAMTMIANLVGDHEALIRNLRNDLEACEKFGDMGTNDFLTGIMQKHEKMAWLLRAFLEDE
ncbi:MAG: DNA starvation/stationary phase protection protein [Chloroflexi bacterium AL-N10]|nr:DNA starvation/stationary phase protection protein [Chloroflexi bacterium AL-N1]NOK69886.1 DNA starvation/stationary phase protection protein [Chloroflexi bacterium AL-N10]NOK73817.1 DNA starvation/stationary phase protection protein [Chloroflexi bacterium AL-N5]NOK91619.1 DNA starvation/stationary phase protection protein [Chloroflexi bacterium AL-N15]